MPWDRVIQEGPAAIHGVLSEFVESFTVEMDVAHLGGDDKEVFFERTEHFLPRGDEGGLIDLASCDSDHGLFCVINVGLVGRPMSVV
jgi:hypothetical protein